METTMLYYGLCRVYMNHDSWVLGPFLSLKVMPTLSNMSLAAIKTTLTICLESVSSH